MGTTLDSVVRLLSTLIKRPRIGEPPRSGQRDERRTRRRGLPMLCLVRPPGIRVDLLEQLQRQLDGARPRRIPHAVCTLDRGQAAEPWQRNAPLPPAETADVAPVHTMLTSLAKQLSSSENAEAGAIRFSRFGLVSWLMDQDLGPTSLNSDSELRRRLREHDLRRFTERRAAITPPDPAPGWLGWLAALLVRLTPGLWSTLRQTGRVPLISGKYRWLRKQRYLSPNDPGSLIGFAERLTKANAGAQDPNQLLRLLVHAFLTDLRRAYGHRGWPWRLRGARRMAYVTVVLDGISRDNRGYLLLRVINDVRSETGRFDPLLVISASEMKPPHADSPDNAASDSALGAYEEWQERFVTDSRAGAETAWYLTLRVQDVRPVNRVLLHIDRPPWWSHRGVAVALVLLLVLAGLFPVGRWRAEHCGLGPSSAAALLQTEGTQCVGVSDGSYHFASGNDKIVQVEDTIRRQNEKAQRFHLLAPARPYAQLVFFAALTNTSAPADPLVSEREELEGVAAFQHRQLNDPSAPLLRILLANGGERMRYGPKVARIVRTLAARDHSIVGVVGLDQSRQTVYDTIGTLNHAGLPIVAATLSGDQMTAASPLYFQVSPQNRREAQMAVSFTPAILHGRDPRQVRVVHSKDPADLYVTSLVRDVHERFSAHGYTVHDVALSARDPAEIGRRTCGFGGLVFFAGRPAAFSGYLRGINETCRDAPPTILAADDVSRYAANAKRRTRYAAVPFYYISFAVGSTTCRSDTGPSQDVYRTIKHLFPFECRSARQVTYDPSLDGHALLAYDATWCLAVAVGNLEGSGIPVSPGAVWSELSHLRLYGQSGYLTFAPDQHVSRDKAIVILRVEHGRVHTTGFRCGLLPGAQREHHLCPVDES